MNLLKTKEKYQSFKNILTILEDGNIHDERYKLLIKSLNIERVDTMRRFIRECESYGIQYLQKSN